MAGDPLTGPAVTGGPGPGQLRRLTIMFCDLVGSTAMSTRHEPELYRQILGHYKRTCQDVVEGTYDGHIAKVKGDGLLVFFGHPSAHEDDVRRAVRAGLDLLTALRRLSAQVEQDVGEALAARVAVHRGPVYLDPDEDDVYGLAANVAARLQELAPPGALVVSDEVRRLLGDGFATEPQEPRKVKGLDDPLASWRVVDERRDRSGRWRRWSTPLVGRAVPLAALRDAWRARPGGVVVRGEAGIGKSRLAGALAAEVAEDGARIVEVTGSPLHAAVGFHPLRVLVERASRSEAGAGPGARADAGARPVGDAGPAGPGGPVGDADRLHALRRHLARRRLDDDELVPLLAPVLGIDPAAGYVPPASEGRKLLDDITAGLGRYLRALLDGGPALLLVDDGQWLDEPTRQLIAGLVAAPPPQLLVVVTARDAAGWLPSAVTAIDLPPLTVTDGAALVAGLDPAGVLAGEQDGIVARGDGIPLYLEELARAAIEGPPPDDGGPPSRPDIPAHLMGTAGAVVPEVLYEPLLARLQATAGGIQVAGAAATIGREVDRPLLARVVDVGEGQLDAAVDDLVGGTVLVAEPGPGDRYRFRHELLREVAYELQPPSVRRLVHGRVADALAATVEAGWDGADWRVLAHHNERAERPAAALGCYERSAEEARRRGALAEARADLGRAIDLLWALPDDDRADDVAADATAGDRTGSGGSERLRSEVWLRLRRAFLAISTEGNASPTAAADHERCLALATADRSGHARFTTLIALWGHCTSRGDLARARAVLEELREALEDGRRWFRPENEAGFGILDWFGGRFPEALDQLERAAAAVRSRADDRTVRAEWFLPNDPRVAISTHLALARFTAGDPAGAREAFAQAEQQAAALPFPQGPFSAAYNHLYAAWAHGQLGRLDMAEHHVEQVERLARRHGFDFMTLAGATQRAELDAARARQARPPDPAGLATAAATLAGLVGAWQLLDVRVFLTTVLTSLAATLAAAGDVDAARDRLEESLRLADETGCTFHTAETLRRRALLAEGPAAVTEGLHRALDRARAQGHVPVRLRIARDLDERQAPGARAELAAALEQLAPGASAPELDMARTRRA